jgi:GNAT superfamily N-acetyltransferase
LPDRVIADVPAGTGEALPALPVPAQYQMQVVGGLCQRLTGADIRVALRQRFSELESAQERAVAISAGLVRYATAMYMIHTLLPVGRPVRYAAPESEEIPSIPVADDEEPASALTAATDAIVEQETADGRHGELVVPYVPYARRFYLPQWVAFDEDGCLLTHTVQEAEAHLTSIQRFVGVLHAAVAVAAYMVADEEYQRKRYGILGQLVNQGRALARHQTLEIIRAIQERAAAGSLNRGLSLSLPYFDDQSLQMKVYKFHVIPAGRIMFVPAFVVRAAREEQVKVAQDTRLSPSTRKYLLEGLVLLEQAFLPTSSSAMGM